MMSAGSQGAFFFPHMSAESHLRSGEIVVDLFAGGGGASHALESALARAVDVAINHNEWAIAMHAANHPYTRHLCEDVWHADPRVECRKRPVGWMHASPDCTHFSQAKGGQPRSRATRSLSWVVLRWAGAVLPRIISLENVEQILKWGPLVAKRDKATGRVVTLDVIPDPANPGKTVHRIADKGERTPIDNQFLIPDKRHEGRTWHHFVTGLRRLGYTVEWRKLKACDFGAGTSRTRLFMVARCDGEPIRWPEPTHGPKRAQPYVTAADCIDWSIPCPSIFQRKKPLADATMRRIARGVKRYVLDAAEPFIVGVGGRMGQTMERPVSEPAQTITAKADSCVCVPVLVQCANASANGIASAGEPLGTVTAWPKGGAHAVVAPMLVPRYGERDGQAPRAASVQEPLATIVPTGNGATVVAPVLIQASHGEGSGATARRGSGAHDIQAPVGTIHAGGGSFAVAAPTLVKFRGNHDDGTLDDQLSITATYVEQASTGGMLGRAADAPLGTIMSAGTQQRLVTANIVTMRNNAIGDAVTDPLGTITAGTVHHAVVECTLSPEHEAGALRVAAFLINYYGNGQALDLAEPTDTITTRDRLALVTVTIQGTPYVVVDIGLRMLRREELFRAQGFPSSYVIDRTADGRIVPVWRSVAMVGNSVSPPPLRAIAIANLDAAPVAQRVAA